MNTRVARFSGEHRYYVAAAVGIIVVVLAGFSVDFGLLSDMSGVSWLVRVHGLVMLTWIALFFAQTVLVGRHRVDLHMRLGIFGAALALLIVILGAFTIAVAVHLGGNHMPGMRPALFLANGWVELAIFAGLAGSGLALRRRHPDAHKRLMLLATILLLDAALARFIGAYTHWTLDSGTARDWLMLACIVVDVARTRRLHPAFVIGGLAVFSTEYIAGSLAGTATWAEFAARVIR
jgi:hypothetical protein